MHLINRIRSCRKQISAKLRTADIFAFPLAFVNEFSPETTCRLILVFASKRQFTVVNNFLSNRQSSRDKKRQNPLHSLKRAKMKSKSQRCKFRFVQARWFCSLSNLFWKRKSREKNYKFFHSLRDSLFLYFFLCFPRFQEN